MDAEEHHLSNDTVQFASGFGAGKLLGGERKLLIKHQDVI